jgi:hypothetical protein
VGNAQYIIEGRGARAGLGLLLMHSFIFIHSPKKILNLKFLYSTINNGLLNTVVVKEWRKKFNVIKPDLSYSSTQCSVTVQL